MEMASVALEEGGKDSEQESDGSGLIRGRETREGEGSLGRERRGLTPGVDDGCGHRDKKNRSP